MEKQRIIYFDFLRIFAALAVILLHVAAGQNVLNETYHYSACFWNGIARWGVPVFVMISGALFLEPTKVITISNIFKKYIFRIAVLFLVWSLFYACLVCVSKNNFDFHFFIKNLISGHFHQWFLYMIAGLYLITPILRPIAAKKDKNLLLYLLIIWFVITSVIPFITFIFPQTTNFFNKIINGKLNLYFPSSFLGYFVLGYYLHNFVNIKNKVLIIMILLFSLSVIVLGEIKYSIPGTETFLFKSFSPFVIITAISIFLFIKNKCLQTVQENKIITKLSNLTLGVYLIHPIFIRLSEKLGLFGIIDNLLHDSNFIAIPIMFVVISGFSFATVYILSKIPIIKKYCL